MPNDKEKLLRIMNDLEIDYRNGRISEEKYRYFRSKYQDKLNSLDAREATNRIRSMQGKKTSSNSRRIKKPTKDNKREEQELVQKYIVNPKRGDKSLNQKEKKEMDSGTFKLLAVLILVIAFTGGIAFGIFNFDFESMSVVNAEAVVVDTAFPDVEQVNVTNTTVDSSSQDSSSSSNASDTGSQSEGTDSDYQGGSSSDTGGSGGGQDSGSHTPSGGSESGGGSEGGSEGGV